MMLNKYKIYVGYVMIGDGMTLNGQICLQIKIVNKMT